MDWDVCYRTQITKRTWKAHLNNEHMTMLKKREVLVRTLDNIRRSHLAWVHERKFSRWSLLDISLKFDFLLRYFNLRSYSLRIVSFVRSRFLVLPLSDLMLLRPIITWLLFCSSLIFLIFVFLDCNYDKSPLRFRKCTLFIIIVCWTFPSPAGSDHNVLHTHLQCICDSANIFSYWI